MASSPLAFLSLLTVIVPLLLAVIVTVAIVLGVRALGGIDRSLRALVEQGVARGEGPYDSTTP